MLETIREYAYERLAIAEEIDALSQAHAAYYASLTEAAASELRRARQGYWFARLHSEYDNLRAALTWSLNSAAVEYGLRITAALRDYWYYTGILQEHQSWTDLALERMSGASERQQAGVLMSAGLLYALRRDKRDGLDLAQRAFKIYSQLGDEDNTAWSQMFLSVLYFDQPARYPEAMSLCQASLGTFQAIGDLPGQAQALNILGEYLRLTGKLEDARRHYEQCLELVKRTGEKLREGMISVNLGFIAYHQGEHQQALELMRNFIRIGEELGNDYGLLTGIAALSGPLAALGQPERGAQLLAAAETHITMSGSDHQTSDLPEFVNYKISIRDQLGDEAFQAAWEAGSRLTMRQVLALAMEDTI
jgi:tetratricopeptide (TPR) repeat protein